MISLAAEGFWVDKACFHNAERQYYEYLAKEELAETKASSQNCQEDKLDNSKEQRTKLLKKPKKLKPKKNENGTKDTLTSESDEQILSLATSQLNPPTKMVEVVNSTTERNKKRNKSKKKVEPLLNSSQIFAEPKANGGDFVPSKGGVSATKLNKTFSDAKIKGTATNNQCTLVSEIAKAREHIKNSLEKMDGIATLATSPIAAVVLDRIVAIEKDNADLKNSMENLKTLCLESQRRITELEKQLKRSAAQSENSVAVAVKKSDPADDDEVDLFGSDSEEESEEAARVREERLAAYAAKKSKKPTIIAKSNLILDVKPWDDQTDLVIIESSIRKIECDGLIWGASKFIPVAYGIKKLSISCVVEDEKVSIDWLTEEIEKLEDYVQSVDIAAFNKI